MPDAKDGTPYADWVRWSKKEGVGSLAAQHEFVVLYDAKGRSQRVRGSNVPGMLAKRLDGKQVFFGEDPTVTEPSPEPELSPEPEPVETGPKAKAPNVSKKMWRK